MLFRSRKRTERMEGIGSNALLYQGKIDRIEQFACEYKIYIHESLVGTDSPSDIICDSIL